MTYITKKDLRRDKMKLTFGLGDDYKNVVEMVVAKIKEDKAYKTTDILTAIELVMLDFKVENSGFHDILKPFYNENYDLIPTIGIDGLMNLAVENHITDSMLNPSIARAVGLILASDYMIYKTKPVAKYMPSMLDYIDKTDFLKYIDIQEMYDKIDRVLEDSEVKPQEDKKDYFIKIIILEDNSMENDLTALLKMLNGSK